MINPFSPADILLPDLKSPSEWEKYSTIACDQFTSSPEYWTGVTDFVGNAPSALNLVLPEIYLDRADEIIPKIRENTAEYKESVLKEYKNALVFVERRQSDGRIRRGIVGKIDLEAYDYAVGSTPLIRATEGTVLSRIPPRVKIRSGASVELPHVMLLINDAEKTVIEPLREKSDSFTLLYDFDLMFGGGHIKGSLIDTETAAEIVERLSRLASPEGMKAKYGSAELPPFLYAVGDGNHSLASAKAYYEELKKSLGKEAENHPARYALVEIVNLFDDALSFEPIHRILFGVNPDDVINECVKYGDRFGANCEQNAEYVTEKGSGRISLGKGSHSLDIGSLQNFIDEYISSHSGVTVDYIHDDEELARLSSGTDRIGFRGTSLSKETLFSYVVKNGALPRKTFSMGDARDKRYYLEARSIVK